MEFYKTTYCNILALQCLLFSAVQQSESAIYIYTYISSFLDFPFRSSQSTEYGSLCYTVGSDKLAILYIVRFN